MEKNKHKEESSDSTEQSDSECGCGMNFDYNLVEFMISQIKDIYKKQISRMEIDHAGKIEKKQAELESRHAAQIVELERKHAKQITDLERKHAEQIAELEKRHAEHNNITEPGERSVEETAILTAEAAYVADLRLIGMPEAKIARLLKSKRMFDNIINTPGPK